MRRLGATLIVLSLGLLVPPPQGAQGGNAGSKCTIEGTQGSDRLVGTTGPDRICGLGGQDIIAGRSGNDRLIGGSGNDVLRAGKGDDLGDGGAGDDRLFGGPQDDRLLGRSGDDFLVGGSGRNLLRGGLGQDVINYTPDPGPPRCPPGSETYCDGEGPRIESMTMSMSSVDTSATGQVIDFTVTAVDSGIAGLDGGLVSAMHPSGQGHPAFLNQTEGDSQRGTFAGRLYLPRYSAQGTWQLNLSLKDRHGNHTGMSSSELAARGFPSSFVQSGVGDAGPPQISEVTFSHRSVDTSTQSQEVTFRLRVTDDVSGVRDDPRLGTGVFVSATHVPEPSTGWIYADATRISGDACDGVYTGALRFPAGSQPGTWNLRIGAWDAAENYGLMIPHDLQFHGYQSTIEQTGPGDEWPPQAVEFSASPLRIDTAGGPATVTFRARVSDAGIGVRMVSVSAYLNGAGQGEGAELSLISGDRFDGVYEGSLTLPQHSPQGDYFISLWMTDEVGQTTAMTPHDLRARGWPGTFTNSSAP